ncbi:MAG: SAM-dependent methyltransferase [Burkholderiales bacterium PBB4]|nr:MAG: SAM-dependent methyltransferase [Burkholderiales bacterium PBB4]
MLDYFAPVWVLTSYQATTDAQVQAVGAALQLRHQALTPDTPFHWVFQHRGDGPATTRLMAGEVPDPHTVTEHGLHYRVHVLKGQNNGLFLDMAEGRRWVANYATARPRIKVLNLFAYTCAFSVVALDAGARHVVNVDMSQGALAIGQQNHRLNDIQGGASFLAHDIFKSWGKISRGGPYDLVIVDPPSYQKGSFVATKDYARLMRRLPDLLEHDGHALLCLTAPELASAFLKDQMQELAPELVWVQRLANPPAFEDEFPEKALKVLVYKAPG